MPLTFRKFRKANVDRFKFFPTCEDWSPAQWLQALVGEIGEYANLRKKYERSADPKDTAAFLEFQKEAAKELADCQTYLDLLAHRLGINLAKATAAKFNEVSDRVKAPIKLDVEDA